jgi:hypothetical protein
LLQRRRGHDITFGDRVTEISRLQRSRSGNVQTRANEQQCEHPACSQRSRGGIAAVAKSQWPPAFKNLGTNGTTTITPRSCKGGAESVYSYGGLQRSHGVRRGRLGVDNLPQLQRSRSGNCGHGTILRVLDAFNRLLQRSHGATNVTALLSAIDDPSQSRDLISIFSTVFGQLQRSHRGKAERAALGVLADFRLQRSRSG